MKNQDTEFQINERIWQNEQKVGSFQPCIQFVPIIYQFTLHTNFTDFKPNLHSWVPWRLNQTPRKTHPISSFRWRKLLSHTSSIKCFTCNYLVIYPIFSFLNQVSWVNQGGQWRNKPVLCREPSFNVLGDWFKAKTSSNKDKPTLY